MVVCTNCGKENQPHYKFCLYCGSAIAFEGGGAPVLDEAVGAAELHDTLPSAQEADEEGLTIPARTALAPRPMSEAAGWLPDLDASETPLPVPRPPPFQFTGESKVVPIEGGGAGSSGGAGPEAAPTSPRALEAAARASVGDAAVRAGDPTGRSDGTIRAIDATAAVTTMRPDAPMRQCPTCKAPVPVGFQFCGQCGGRMDVGKRTGAHAHDAARGRLVLIRPDGSEGGAHPLSDGLNLIGRGTGPLFDADSYLSPLHVQIELQENGMFTLRDSGSLNGVFVKLMEEEPISDGAVFRIGQELLRFDTIRHPRPLEDGTEVMGSPNPGYWGRIAIIIGRAQDGSCFPLFGDAVVLGRERGDILFSEDGYVSGTHARISYRHGQVYLQDLASSNGTFLKVRQERTVRSGTFALMGQQLFRVMLG